MKLKTVTVGDKIYAEISDGKPVYVEDDGKEIPFDAPHTRTTISRLNGESKGFRERAEAAEEKLKTFDGIENVDAARKALETVANLDKGQLKTAEQVAEITRQAQIAAEKQVVDAAKASSIKIQELEGKYKKLSGEYDGEKVTNAFAGSSFIREKVAAPLDMVQALFGQRFKREEGRLVGYDSSGNKIFSRAKPGELAEFDEAIEMTIDAYPNRDAILKGVNAGGSGARPGAGGANGSKKTISRSDFDKLDPVAQRAAAIGKDAMTIID